MKPIIRIANALSLGEGWGEGEAHHNPYMLNKRADSRQSRNTVRLN